MNYRKLYRVAIVIQAGVWLYFSFQKLLPSLNRHQEIVSEVTSGETAVWLTPLIGIGEFALASWLLFRKSTPFIALVQVALVLTMNIIEQIKAPELLLFGLFNFILAILFCTFILVNEFWIKKKITALKWHQL